MPLALRQNGIGGLPILLTGASLSGIPIAAWAVYRHRSFKRLREREGQLLLMSDNAPDAVVAFDALGRCCFASKAAAGLYRCERGDLLGRRVWDLIDRRDWQLFKAVLRRLNKQTGTQKLVFRRPSEPGDNVRIFLEARCRLIPFDGSHDGVAVIASVRDVTEQVWFERDLIEARKRAEAAAVAKSRFLANMSHEIRTPMNGVLGFAELLAGSDLDEEQLRKVMLIVESGKAMMDLLNDILDMSKIEVGALTALQEPVQISEVLESCAAIGSALAERKGLRLRFRLDPALPASILGDAARLRQIVLNLIGNAIKFTEKGTVTLSAQRHGKEVAIAVSDEGIGIPSDRMEAIFKPFEQAEGTTSRCFGGTGLGLSISRELTTLMGGTLSATSRVAEGSCFTIRLPLVEVEADPGKRSDPGHTRPHTDVQAHGKRILLVDDHEVNRALASEMLASLGYSCVLAIDGFEAIAAIEAARAADRPFDLVLMDIQMPRCDGMEAARAIRQAGISPLELPIVAMTANAYTEDVDAALRAGMQDHVAKPISLESLSKTLLRWTKGQRQGRSAVAVQDLAADGGDRLAGMWRDSRAVALGEVARFLASPADNAAQLALERQMHKISGTARHFGESHLGKSASALEMGLRKHAPLAELKTLARKVLEAGRELEEHT